MAKLTVLGIGNLLMQDDGVGVRLLHAVRDARRWPDDVEFVDGGVGGLNLLGVIEDARRLVVFDAAAMGLSAGEFRILQPEQVGRETAGRISLHDCPFLETLELTARFFRAPETTLFAVQVAQVERGLDLSPALSGAFGALIAPARELVEQILAET
ncbi:MAG: hydrogenase maturation protease [Planctomycetota bacterium]